MNLRKANPDEHQLLKDICLEYISELLPLGKVSIDKMNELMDRYFAEEDRHPYFIFSGDTLCGFVLVNSWCVIEKRVPCRSIGEFYIRPSYRRQKIGTSIACQIFDLHPGHWEIRQMADNATGTSFWIKVLDDYTAGKFTQTQLNDERWKGAVQMFSNAG